MDVGFSIAALNGFPGPFVKYINDWLSEEQLLRMLDEADDRTAHFIDVLAVGFPGGTVKTFSHTTGAGWPKKVSTNIPNGPSIRYLYRRLFNASGLDVRSITKRFLA